MSLLSRILNALENDIATFTPDPGQSDTELRHARDGIQYAKERIKQVTASIRQRGPADTIHKPLVIIESPYAANEYASTEDHVEYAKRCLTHSLSEDTCPIASHLLFTQEGVLDDSVAWERKLGIEAGLAWYRAADACHVYLDYGISSGMMDGVRTAMINEVPIVQFYIGVNTPPPSTHNDPPPARDR